MKCPSIIDVRDVVKSAQTCAARVPGPGGIQMTVPARAQFSIDSIITRIRAAWLVWTGRADAVTWPGQ